MRINSIYGLLGFAVPTIIMVIAYPVLVKALGTDSFGIYVLAMAISGSVAFLDLGFSSAMIKFVAEDMAKNDVQNIADVLVSSLVFYACMGGFLVLVIWGATPWLVSLFSIKEQMHAEAVLAFRLASLQLLIMFVMNVYLGLFKGLQRFDLSTFLLSSLSALTYGGIIIGVMFFDAGLVGVIQITVAANVIALAMAATKGASICSTYGVAMKKGRVSIPTYKRMLGFGAAMTVMSIAGILNSQLQRIVLGILVGPQGVAAFHLGTFVPAKANAATMALSEPLYPMVASKIGKDDKELGKLYRRYMMVLFIVSGVMLAPFVFASEMIFSHWLGRGVPDNTPEIAVIFSVGLFINVLGQPAYHFLNGMGKPWLNTIFSFVNPILLYVSLFAIYMVNGKLDVMDFAWATMLSLVASAVIYVVWYELALLRRKQVSVG